MRININGNDVTPNKIADALSTCEREYNLRIKGATIYVRYENDVGQTVEPLMNGEEFSRSFSFWKPKNSKSHSPQSNLHPQIKTASAISSKEMIELCKNRVRRNLSNGEMTFLINLANTMNIDQEVFQQCLELSLTKNGFFNITSLNSLLVCGKHLNISE